MVGDFASDMYLRTVVGMGSRSKDELDDWDIKLVISSGNFRGNFIRKISRK